MRAADNASTEPKYDTPTAVWNTLPVNGIAIEFSGLGGVSSNFQGNLTVAEYDVPAGKVFILTHVMWHDNPQIFCSLSDDINLSIFRNATKLRNWQQVRPGAASPLIASATLPVGFRQNTWVDIFALFDEKTMVVAGLAGTLAASLIEPRVHFRGILIDKSGRPLQFEVR